MKKVLIVLLFVVAGAFICGNALAITTYIPHITGGETGWTDYLQVNNNTSSSANFTLTLYNGGNQIYSHVFSVGGLSRSQIEMKALHPSAETGVITYTESGLVFRVSYNNLSGGIAEFKTIDALGSKVGLYFSDFTSFVQWKGAAIANMGPTPADVTLYAIGGGSILGTHTITIAAKTKAVGIHSVWFSSLNLSQVESIVAVTSSSSLCGIAISGDTALSRLLFTPATPVNFSAPDYSGTWFFSGTRYLNDCNVSGIPTTASATNYVTQSGTNVVVVSGSTTFSGTTHEEDGFEVYSAPQIDANGCRTIGGIRSEGASDGTADSTIVLTVQCGSVTCAVGYRGTAVRQGVSPAISIKTESDVTLDAFINQCSQQAFKTGSGLSTVPLDEEGLKAAATDALKSTICGIKDNSVR